MSAKATQAMMFGLRETSAEKQKRVHAEWADVKKFYKEMWNQGGFFLPAQAAVMLGCSRPYVHELMQKGTLTSFNRLGKVYVSGNEVMDMREEKEREKKRKKS